MDFQKLRKFVEFSSYVDMNRPFTFIEDISFPREFPRDLRTISFIIAIEKYVEL